ncbi:MAG TPA: HAD hydrolase family protein [Erysipelothrix sp.]
MKFVFDIDGTICFDYTDLSQEAMQLLDLIEDQGHEVIFASARPIRDMVPVIKDKYQHHRLIGANGAMVSINNEVIDMCHFSADIKASLLELLKRYEAIFLADGAWDYHYNGDGSHELMKYVNAGELAKNDSLENLGDIMKIVVFEANDLEGLMQEIAALDLSFRQHPSTLSVDIVACHTNKFEALKKQGITDYVAMGNDINDKEMLAHATVSIMIDHHDDLHELVDHKVAYDENYLDNLKAIFAPYL